MLKKAEFIGIVVAAFVVVSVFNFPESLNGSNVIKLVVHAALAAIAALAGIMLSRMVMNRTGGGDS